MILKFVYIEQKESRSLLRFSLMLVVLFLPDFVLCRGRLPRVVVVRLPNFFLTPILGVLYKSV